MIKDLKSKDELKGTIKKNYKVFDKLSEDYYTSFWNVFSNFIPLLVKESHVSLEENEEFLSLVLVKELTVGDILTVIKDDAEKAITWNYIYVLSIIASVYNTYDSSSELNEEEEKQLLNLYEKVIRIIGMIQKSEDYSDVIDDIVDDDIKGLLVKIIVTQPKVSEEKSKDSTGTESMFGQMQGSKIMGLAKEISESIDVSQLNLESPQDVLKMLDFSGSNNILTDIIGKVSTSIQGKISSGELKQEDLFGEAMSMMGSLGGGAGGAGGLGGLGAMFNNPMMAEMFKNMQKGKTPQTRNTGAASSDTKERLRRKLAEKKKNRK